MFFTTLATLLTALNLPAAQAFSHAPVVALMDEAASSEAADLHSIQMDAVEAYADATGQSELFERLFLDTEL